MIADIVSVSGHSAAQQLVKRPKHAYFSVRGRNGTRSDRGTPYGAARLQALFGFQLITGFNERFRQLSNSEQVLHFVALVLSAVAIALIMTPAACHRQRRYQQAAKVKGWRGPKAAEKLVRASWDRSS